MRLQGPILSTGPAGRILRNLLFWLLFALWHSSGRPRLWPAYPALLGVIFLSYAPGGYAHNLWLIPRFLLRRKYALYIALLAGVLLATAGASWYLTGLVNRLVPGLGYMGTTKGVALLYHLFPTLLMLSMLAFGKFTADAISNQRKLEDAQKRQLESELHSLRAQINPHFLFNALNTIYGMARREDRDTAQAVMQLSGILRHNLYDCEEATTTLAGEILFLEQYVAFARLRLHERERVMLRIEGEAGGLRIAPLLLTPFVENAVKHGLAQHSYRSWVEILLRMEGRDFFFRCRNSLHPPAAQPAGGRGIGLKNVRRRLALLYPERHSLEIKESGETYDVSLRLRLD